MRNTVQTVKLITHIVRFFFLFKWSQAVKAYHFWHFYSEWGTPCGKLCELIRVVSALDNRRFSV